MAAADYRLCDVCGEKVFYDANLNYADHRDRFAASRPAFRTAGEDQGEYGMKLDYLGDWAVICYECAKTHKTIVVPIDTAAQKGAQP